MAAAAAQGLEATRAPAGCGWHPAAARPSQSTSARTSCARAIPTRVMAQPRGPSQSLFGPEGTMAGLKCFPDVHA